METAAVRRGYDVRGLSVRLRKRDRGSRRLDCFGIFEFDLQRYEQRVGQSDGQEKQKADDNEEPHRRCEARPLAMGVIFRHATGRRRQQPQSAPHARVEAERVPHEIFDKLERASPQIVILLAAGRTIGAGDRPAASHADYRSRRHSADGAGIGGQSAFADLAAINVVDVAHCRPLMSG